MSSKIIEAKAVISAADKTGSVFDAIAKKMKGVAAAGKELDKIKPPRFLGDLEKELQRLKLTEKEMNDVRMRRQRMLDAVWGSKADLNLRARQDWMDKEVAHWRKMKAGINEAEVAQRRWKQTMVGAGVGVMARGAALAGGTYAAARVGKAGIKAAATGQRESARDYLAGITPENSKRLEEAAYTASRQYQSVDSNTMHAQLREAASSMRSTDKAVELKDTIGQMMTVLQSLKGKDKAVEEARKFFSALDVLGKNVDPKEIRELAQGYTQAVGVEGADFDLGRVLAMSKQLKSAGATVSNRFLMTSGVSLGRDMGDEKAGNAIAMAMQQEQQATKDAKGYGQSVGLRDKSGKFIDRGLMMSDPDLWAWKHFPGIMKKAKLDPDKHEDVNTFLNKAYSNQSSRNLFSKLMTQGDQYKAQAQTFGNAPGLKAAGSLQGRDPFVAYEAVFAQLRTLSAQAPVMEAAAGALQQLNNALANLNKWVETGKLPEKTYWGRIAKQFNETPEDTNERNHLSSMKQRLDEAEQKQKWTGVDPQTMAGIRLKAFELRSGISASENYAGRGSMFGDDEIKRWRDELDERNREHNRGNYGGRRSDFQFPASDPRKAGNKAFPDFGSDDSVKTSNVNVEGDVKGEVEVKLGEIKIDSSGLATLVGQMTKALADITGKMRTLSANTNGPGSTGRTSPDAQAPGGTGFGGGGM
jgi:hypothetical protein